MRPSLLLATVLVLGFGARLPTASAQPPPSEDPPYPSEEPPPSADLPPAYDPEPRYGLPQPGYGQPPAPGYGHPLPPGYGPPPGPPPPPLPEEEEKGCCFWSVRYDPFDLLFRRVTLEGEINIWGPLALQLSPSWIFDSPAENMTEQGFDVSLDFVWYIQGQAFHGFWLKAHAEFEIFKATLEREISGSLAGIPNPDHCDADSETGTCSKTINTFVFGAMIGTSTVFGKDGGFAISGGIGIGVAVAPAVTLIVDSDTPDAPGVETTYFDKSERIRLLGSLGLGIAF